MTGRLLALTIVVVTAALITIGTLWPIQSASAMAGLSPTISNASTGSDSPQAAAQTLMQLISQRNWGAAYASLANKREFSETEFVRDLTGSYASLHTYATLDGFDVNPLNAGSSEAQVQTNLNWSSVVGSFQDVRTLRVIKAGDRWQVVWPINREAKVPPQVIPVNYYPKQALFRPNRFAIL